MEFLMEFFNDYMVFVVVGICLCVGYIIKNFIPTDKINKYIPLIMAILGIGLNVWLNGLVLSPEILLGGLVSGLASTGLYEAFNQFIKKNK